MNFVPCKWRVEGMIQGFLTLCARRNCIGISTKVFKFCLMQMSKAFSLLVLREYNSCPEEGQSVSTRSRVDNQLVQQDSRESQQLF